VIDDFAKEHLHGDLRWAREVLVWKLDGLSKYDIRRPLTATGTNLLGLVKHSATWESRYFGEVFDRPFPEPLLRWDDKAARGTDLWVRGDETREGIVALYERVWKHADVELFSILVHILTETNRHAGHADILREQLDGRTGVAATHERRIDPAAREARRAKIEQAARAASGVGGEP
jgi:Protein of unknown function (DUF664)